MSKTSYEDKIEAIKRIKNSKAGINGTARKSGIHPETLRSWIMWYNDYKEFKERSSAKGGIYITIRKKNHAGRTSRDSGILHRTLER